MSKIIKITAFFLFFVMCFCVHNTFAAVASCSGVNNDGQTHYGTIDGACWAYYCSNGTINKLGSVASSNCSSGSCSAGATQTKYTADKDGCSYDTKTRECCSDGNWSNWGTECCKGAACCTSSQCWNGSTCTSHGEGITYYGKSGVFYNGKCYYTCSNWKCTTGSGWSCASMNPLTVQGGSFNSTTYYSNNGGKVCSTKVTSSDAVKACCQQGASDRGIPESVMCGPTGYNIQTGDCYYIAPGAQCQCLGSGSKTFYAPSNINTLSSTAAQYCGGYGAGYSCPAKKLSCSSKTYSC